MTDKYRGKFISIIIQPKIHSKFWLYSPTDNEINKSLMESSFPLFTEIQNFLSILKVATVNDKTIIPVLRFAFGSETSVKTKIPHYQIYLEFDKLIRNSSVYQSLDALLANRAHIVKKKGL